MCFFFVCLNSKVTLRSEKRQTVIVVLVKRAIFNESFLRRKLRSKRDEIKTCRRIMTDYSEQVAINFRT